MTALLLLAVVGIGCRVPPDGELARVQAVSEKPRVGNVYLLRGWIGVFSTGIDALGEKIDAAGVRSSVYQDTQWGELAETIKKKYASAAAREPIVLVGHSYGADDVVRIARELEDAKIPVELVVTLDPVTPPKVPGNVRTAYNLFQSNAVMDLFPWLRGVPLKKEDAGAARVVNVDIREQRKDLLEPGLDHFNIEKKGKIHDEVLRQVLAVCPPRGGGVATGVAPRQTVSGGGGAAQTGNGGGGQ